VPCAKTNMTKLTVAFHNFANVPKNGKISGGDNTTDRGFYIQRTGPCIVIYYNNKNQKDALISQIYFGKELCMF